MVGIVSSLAALCFVFAYAGLGRLEDGGPRHEDVWLPGDVPGTLYLPGPGTGDSGFTEAPPPETVSRMCATRSAVNWISTPLRRR